jgi:hypothetical protein
MASTAMRTAYAGEAERLVLIFITWRPRYVPQFGHAWCDGFGLRHCGQATRFCALSAR